MTRAFDRAELNGIALDLGGTKLAAARVVEGNITARAIRPTQGHATAQAQIEHMLRMAEELGLSDSDDVGMAVTGRVDADGIWHAVNVETLTEIAEADLNTLGTMAFKRPVSVINDALAAAIAEYRFGAGRHSRAMAYVTVSTGVGGGLVLDGAPVTSQNGLAGHVGFSTSRLATGQCGSGRIGTVESIAAGRAIAAEAIRRRQPVESAKDVFDHWQKGAPWADEIIDTSAAAIAELCGNLSAMLGIDRVVLGGSIGLANRYATRVREHIAREPALFRPDLTTASLGQDGVLLGALS